MIWARSTHEEKMNAYAALGNSEGKRPLGRPGRRWEDNIKIDLKEQGEVVYLADNRDHWQAFVSTAMDLRVQ
jgi:hypothetical protein